MNYKDYMSAIEECISQVEEKTIEDFVEVLRSVKNKNGRVFFLGVGGSAANCSHAVNDFRKIGGIDALTPLDNVSELTAYINGGGSETTSKNIVKAIQYAEEVDAHILGIVSRDGGYTMQHAHVCIHFCPSDSKMITPVAESLQAVFWHYLVNKI